MTPETTSVSARLSVMMFLQFFVWGAWYVMLGPFMTAMKMGAGIGDAYSVGPIAAIISPIFLGMIADRFFATQRVLAAMHFLGGLFLLAAPLVAQSAAVATVEGAPVRSHMLFVGVLLGHMLCYMPTLGLSNTLAFHNMTNPEKQFPLIRVLGTIGWIVAGLAIGFATAKLVPAVLAADTSESAVKAARAATDAARASSPIFFYLAGGAGILLGLYSLTLPHTPPPAAGRKASLSSLLCADALALMKSPSFTVFVVCSVLVCIPLAAYYAYAGVYTGAVGVAAEDVPITMSYGQMSEIFFMLIMPLCFARLGVKWMLLLGMLAWFVRYGLFSQAWAGTGGNHVMWMVLGGIILHGICYDFFFVTGQIYVDKKSTAEIRGQAQGLLVLVTQGLGLFVGAQVMGRIVKANTTKVAGTEVVDWKAVWAVPCIAAGVIAVIFFLAFRERTASTNPGAAA